MAKSKLVESNKRIAENITSGFKQISDTIVETFTEIEDRFVDQYLTKDGETVDETRKRLTQEHAERLERDTKHMK